MPLEQAEGDMQGGDGNRGLGAAPRTLRGRKITLALGWRGQRQWWPRRDFPFSSLSVQPLGFALGLLWVHPPQPQPLKSEETLQES